MNVSPESTSDVVNEPIVVPTEVFSCCELLLKFNANGASLTLLTLIVNSLSKYKPILSVDLIVTLCELAVS